MNCPSGLRRWDDHMRDSLTLVVGARRVWPLIYIFICVGMSAWVSMYVIETCLSLEIRYRFGGAELSSYRLTLVVGNLGWGARRVWPFMYGRLYVYVLIIMHSSGWVWRHEVPELSSYPSTIVAGSAPCMTVYMFMSGRLCVYVVLVLCMCIVLVLFGLSCSAARWHWMFPEAL